MNEFIRGTTDTITLVVDGDISNAANIELWIDTFSELIRRSKDSLTISASNGQTVVSYKMNQYDSLSCCEDYIAVQLRWIDNSGNVGAIKKEYIPVIDAEWGEAIPTEQGTYGDEAVFGVDRIPEDDILDMLQSNL